MRPFKISCLRAISETRVCYANDREEALRSLESETSDGAVIDVFENKPISEEEARTLLVGKTVSIIHAVDQAGKSSVLVFENTEAALNAAVGKVLEYLETTKLPNKELVDINVHIDAWRLREAVDAFNEAHACIGSSIRISVLDTPILKKIA
jgi:hypothetical protein